jgi:nicotinate-nucleotide pyrophosphorylase (carboxylating)
MNFPIAEAKNLIRMALAEDLGSGDVSSHFAIPAKSRSQAVFIAKQNGVLAGMPFIELVCNELGAPIEVVHAFTDGSRVTTGQEIARIRGNTRDLLAAERTILNFLQHLCGVATETSRYTDILAGSSTHLLDTRKTMPGYRMLEKYAVAQAGGCNHRMGLYDMMMLKDNHIHACGGIQATVEKLLSQELPPVPIEVEVEDIDQLEEVLRAPVHQIMLDNMDLVSMQKAVEVIRQVKPQVKIEASGNMDLQRVRQLRNIGLDYISVGAVTHSAPAMDISLRFRDL